MLGAWTLTILALVSIASAGSSRSTKLNGGNPITNPLDSVLNEIVSVYFNNGGYTISGRGGLTKANVNQHGGITQETAFRNGGLALGLGSTGYFSVAGVDMRDPLRFTPCPSPSDQVFWQTSTKRGSGSGTQCRSAVDGSTNDLTLSANPTGILARFTINFGNYSQICQICEHSGVHVGADKVLLSPTDDSKDWSQVTNCDGKSGTLAVSANTPQVLFSVPVEGNAGNLYLTIKRNPIDSSELKNGCAMDAYKAFYTFALGSGGKQIAKWNVFKYHGIYLEDGMDHTFTVTIPRLNAFNQESTQQWPLLYIDGQFICAEHPNGDGGGENAFPGGVTTDYLVHCKDSPTDSTPNPTLQQELTNKQCRLTRLYLGNAPVSWAASTSAASSQPTGFRRFAGLAGATFKTFQMWNFHGIAEPSNMRLCSEKNSKQCSFYTGSPWCRWTGGSYRAWKTTNPPFYTTINTVCTGTTRSWLNCPTTGGTQTGTTVAGTAANCAFPGSACPAGKICARPGNCIVNT